MASIFPGSPSLNDIFTSNGTTWQWNGEAWVVVADEGQTFNTVITDPSSQTITADAGSDTLTFAAGTDITISGNSGTDTLTISSSLDKQAIINTASAAAYASASGYTNFIVDGLDTLDIEENTNLYFTNQRAIDATSSLITSASANALSEANTYTNSASSSLVGYINTASSSLVNYTDSASASLVSYTDSEISALQVFSNVATSPSTQLITGDSNSDTLTFIAGENISISADSSTDSITINSTGNYTSVDSIAYPDYIVFDTTPENTSASTSTLAWDAGEGGLGIQLNSNVQVTLGQEIIVLANNGEVDTLNKGEVVRLSGAQGQKPKITRAYNTSDAGSALTFGIVAESIASGAEGFVVTQGIVKNIDTDDYNEGDILYLSASAGVLTTVKPQAPNHYVFVGVVTKKNQSSGRIYVKPQNGYELDELHNVRIVSEQNGDIIIWNSASSLWLNEPLQTYLTSASTAAVISSNSYTDSASASLISYTDAEVAAAIVTASAAAAAYTDTEITNLIDSAPGALDTLNELAAALGDDENFATTIINTVASASAAAIAYADGLTTTDIEEGINLYFTNQRAIDAASATYILQSSEQSIINTASAAAVAYADALTTTDIAEGSNLYFTEERVESTASAMFVHNQHTNLNASYSAASGIIILSASGGGGGGGATVAYQTTQPDVTGLDTGSLWIDSDEDAISGLLPATFTRWIKILSASTSTISGLDDDSLALIYTAGYEKVFINGTLLVRGEDYTATNGSSISLTTPAESGDAVEVHVYESFQIADVYTQAQIDAKFNNYTRWSKTYSASATTITGTDDYANTLDYTNNYERVFINGVLLDPSEYTRTSASVITPDEAILSGDVVEVFNIESAQIGDTYTTAQIDAKYNNRTRWTKTYSASATVVSGADDNANSLSYTSGYEEVYLNGILLTPVTDYARTSASVVTLNSAVVSGDIIDVVNTQPFNLADAYTKAQIDDKYNDYTRWTKTLSASATTISGTDNNSTTLSYTPGKEQVYINGSLIMRGTEYTASSGSTVVLNEAAVVDDVIDIVSITPFNIANVYTQTQVDSKVGTNGGLVLVNKTDFSASSAVNVNSCFSSTYDNYRIMFFATLSTGSNQTLRLRASGVDNSGATSYRSQQGTFGGASAAAKRNDTSAFNLNYDSGGSEPPYYSIDVFRPNSTDSVKVISGMGYKSAQADFTSGALTSSTQFDGFSIITSSGTMTGTVRVYGYRNDV